MSTDKLADTIYTATSLGSLGAEIAARATREAFVVIDRDDLPEVQDAFSDGSWRAEHKDANGTWWAGATPEFLHGRALEILALAERLRTNPPVDEEAVEALANDLAVALDRDHARDLARRLVAEGWKREATP